MKWDKSIKSYETFDITGKEIYDNSLRDFVYLIYTSYHSPGFFITARDVFYKNIHVYDDKVLYCFGSSIEKGDGSHFYVNETEDYVRCDCHLNFTKFEEDDEFFYFNSFNQTDLKVIFIILNNM